MFRTDTQTAAIPLSYFVCEGDSRLRLRSTSTGWALAAPARPESRGGVRLRSPRSGVFTLTRSGPSSIRPHVDQAGVAVSAAPIAPLNFAPSGSSPEPKVAAILPSRPINTLLKFQPGSQLFSRLTQA